LYFAVKKAEAAPAIVVVKPRCEDANEQVELKLWKAEANLD
jgi:hypothetical protein